jgi:apolipoprotein D and lipocalin family protein
MKILMFIILLVSCQTLVAKNSPLDTVNAVELDRYLGKWYEIARFDQSFQKGCTAVTAEYSIRKDGDIKVLNTCRLETPTGKVKTAVGRAWVKDKHTNAKLKVQFFLKGLKLPFFAGNYWILELDKDYKHVLVGDPSRKYLWILSRTSKIDSYTYEDLVAKAKDLKFDTSKLIKTAH